MLKIYEFNRGVYGMTIIIAKSKETAIELYQKDHVIYKDTEIDEHEIENGLVINNWGDT